jgi:hypothetical protein
MRWKILTSDKNIFCSKSALSYYEVAL